MSYTAREISAALRASKIVTAEIEGAEKRVTKCRSEFGYAIQIQTEDRREWRKILPTALRIEDAH